MPSDDQKQKLTLGISKEIIEKAKAEKINISDITEKLLTVITYDKGNTRDELIAAYETFLEAIQKKLKKYGTSIKVGESYIFDDVGNIEDEVVIKLWSNGLYSHEVNGESVKKTSIAEEIDSLYSPKQILENLIPALIQAAEKNKAKIKEFEIALRFAEILPDTDEEKKK
jgi:hypothetical protein